MRPRLARIRPGTTLTSIGQITSRLSRPLWLRVALSLPLIVGAFALVGLPSVLGEGSANLGSNGGKRALTEWRTSLYGNFLPRRTLFEVYAKVGEEIALGSSGVGVGSGDIVVWTPGQITAPLTVALPPPAFTCSTSGAGALTTPAQEVAGPLPAAGGYTPCIYTPATTGVYNVAFYGPAGGNSDLDGSAGTIAAPVIDATQNSGVSMWDITVRPVAAQSAPISGRVFTDYLAQITGGNGTTDRVESTLWAVTSDGFKYQIDLRGLDPNGFVLYGNTVGFLNPDGLTPLYHDLVADTNPLSNVEGGVELAPPTGLLFFAPPAGDLPSSIVPTPVVPTVNSITFQGTAGDVSGVPGSVFSTGGNIVFDGNIDGVADVVIVPNPGGSGGCAGAIFDPTLPSNRSLVRVVSAGVQNLAWDGKDNSGAYMPTSWPGNVGAVAGYCFSATLRAGEFHFPLLDAENSVSGGPTITLLNPPGSGCPFASCSTAFFDDRAYKTTNGTSVGTVGTVLGGNTPPPAPDYSDTGFDTASTTIRAYGDNTANGFGNQKGLDLWTYFPSKDFIGQLYIIPQGASDLSIIKTHVGNFTVGANGVYTLTVQNVGSGNLAGLITVSDPVPPELNVVSAAGTGWSCGVSGQDVTCTVTPGGGLASGASLPTISVTVNPAPSAVPTVTNTATVANANDLDLGNNSSSSLTQVDPAADLSISKDDGVASVDTGAPTTYTLVVTNHGPSAVTGALLADPAVAGLAKSLVACAPTPGQCVSPPTIAALEAGTAALPALAATETYRLAVTATVTAASGSVINTATIDPPAGVTDPTPANNSATDTDTVNPAAVLADLAITKTDSTTTVTAGDPTTYILVVTNNGPSSVTGALLADPAVAGLAKSLVACAPTPGQCVSPPTVAELEAGTFALPALAATETYRLVVTATVTAASGSVINTATIDPPAGVTDPTPANNSATDTDTVNSTGAPGLTLAKSASPTTYTAAGNIIAYRYRLTNSGNVALSGPFTVADDKAGVSCPVTASLAVGASITCTASYTITPADVTAGHVTNVATASSANGPTSNQASATVQAHRSPKPTPLPTPPATDTQTVVGSGVPGTSWLEVFGIIAGILATAFVLIPAWMRRRD